MNLGQLEGKEKTWGAVPMASKTVSETAAAMMNHCNMPDDGSAHVCPQQPTSVHDLMSIVIKGRTYNCCFECWLNKWANDHQKILEQFLEVGGYDPQRDPVLDRKKAVFKALNQQRIHIKEGTRVPFNPDASLQAVEKACRDDFRVGRPRVWSSRPRPGSRHPGLQSWLQGFAPLSSLPL